jgi:hypothetical protein
VLSNYWRRLRKLKLRRNPLCECCIKIGRIEPANVVDHIAPINGGGDPYPGLNGLASLCARCHNLKTRGEQVGENYLHKAATHSATRSIRITPGTSHDDVDWALPHVCFGSEGAKRARAHSRTDKGQESAFPLSFDLDRADWIDITDCESDSTGFNARGRLRRRSSPVGGSALPQPWPAER